MTRQYLLGNAVVASMVISGANEAIETVLPKRSGSRDPKNCVRRESDLHLRRDGERAGTPATGTALDRIAAMRRTHFLAVNKVRTAIEQRTDGQRRCRIPDSPWMRSQRVRPCGASWGMSASGANAGAPRRLRRGSWWRCRGIACAGRGEVRGPRGGVLVPSALGMQGWPVAMVATSSHQVATRSNT